MGDDQMVNRVDVPEGFWCPEAEVGLTGEGPPSWDGIRAFLALEQSARTKEGV